MTARLRSDDGEVRVDDTHAYTIPYTPVYIYMYFMCRMIGFYEIKSI